MAYWTRYKFRIIAGIAVIIVLLPLLIISGTQWHTYTSREGKFQVEMPGWALRKGTGGTFPDTFEEFTVTQLMHRSTYSVRYIKFPKIAESSPGDMEVDISIEQSGDRIIAEHQITTKEYTGRDVTIAKEWQGIERMRVLNNGKGFFILSVSPVHGDARVERFFNSFKILK